MSVSRVYLIICLSLPSSLMFFRAHLTTNDISILSIGPPTPQSFRIYLTRSALRTRLGRRVRQQPADRGSYSTGAKARHHYMNSDSQSYPGISDQILTDQPFVSIPVESWISSIPLTFSTFHHTNLVTTFQFACLLRRCYIVTSKHIVKHTKIFFSLLSIIPPSSYPHR